MTTAKEAFEKIVNSWGMDLVYSETEELYRCMESECHDLYRCRLYLITIMARIPDYAPDMSLEKLSRKIRKKCGLNKKAADEMAAVYHEMFTKEKLKEMEERVGYGFREFCEKKVWDFDCEVKHYWHSFICKACISGRYALVDENRVERELSEFMSWNPYATARSVCNEIEYHISSSLGSEWIDFVRNGSDRIPAMKGFKPTTWQVMEKWCRTYGLQLLEFSYHGDICPQWDDDEDV